MDYFYILDAIAFLFFAVMAYLIYRFTRFKDKKSGDAVAIMGALFIFCLPTISFILVFAIIASVICNAILHH